MDSFTTLLTWMDSISAGPKEPETMVVQIPEGARAGDELTITTSNGQDTETHSQFIDHVLFPCLI